MKTNWLPGICLMLAAIAATGCGKKSGSLGEESAAQVKDSAQPVGKQTASAPPGVGKAQTDETEYFAVFIEGKKAGYARHNRVVSEGKVTSSEEVTMTIARAGVSLTATMTVKTVETVEGKPLSFESIQDLGMMKMEGSGTIQPDGKLALINRSAGTAQESTVDWPTGALMSEGLRLLLEEKGLKEGTEYSCRIFEPTMMQALDVTSTVGAKEQVDLLGRVVTLTEVTTALSMPGMGELTSTSYYDDDFNLQKSITPTMGMAMEMVACPKEFALSENDVVELVDKMFIDSPIPLDDLDSAESVTYHLDPIEGAKLVIPPNDNQQVHRTDDGKVTLTVKPVGAPAGSAFPYKGNDKVALEHLDPTQFVQSDHETIVKLAARAVGRAKDAAEAVEKIEAFVADYVEDKNLSVGYASALEVAQSKQGDCTEHAVLAAALCRAVGIPAQVVTGLAYVGEWRDVANGFGGHAWTQAYVGDKWIGLDAAFRGTGRGGYDAGHIALAAGKGDPGDFFSLVTTMGQFKIEKVTVKRK